MPLWKSLTKDTWLFHRGLIFQLWWFRHLGVNHDHSRGSGQWGPANTALLLKISYVHFAAHLRESSPFRGSIIYKRRKIKTWYKHAFSVSEVVSMMNYLSLERDWQWDITFYPLGSLYFFKNKTINLTGVAQWIECGLTNQRDASSIPSQGTCLGCRPGPQ